MFLQRLCLFLVCVPSVHVWACTYNIDDCSKLSQSQCDSESYCTGGGGAQPWVCGNWDNGKCQGYPQDG